MSAWFEASLDHQVGEFRLQIDLFLEREIGVLFGPSGSGKSLTLRLLAGLDTPKRGQVHLGGRQLLEVPGGIIQPPRQRRIGLVFQQLALFPHLNALENVAYGLSGSRRYDIAREWLARVDLKGMDQRYPAQLSGGQKQRVALARALAPEPDLLLLDEPFNTLDSPLRRSLRRELKRLHRETGVPLLYVTHYIEDVCSMGGRIFFLKDGQLTGNINVDQLWNTSSQVGAWHALGWGNLLHGEVCRREGGTWFVWGEGALELPASVQIMGPVSVFIPPNHVKILYQDIPVDPQLVPNVMHGRVVERVSIGSTTSLYVAAAGLQWQLEFPIKSYDRLDLKEGADVRIAVRPGSISLLEHDRGGSEYENTNTAPG